MRVHVQPLSMTIDHQNKYILMTTEPSPIHMLNQAVMLSVNNKIFL